MSEDTQHAIEFTTKKGRTVRLGDHYRDNRDANVRDLKVESIGIYERPGCGVVEASTVCSVTCSVTRTTEAGTQQMKPTTMTAERITSREFVLMSPTFRPVVTAELADGGVL
ncbi:hypothetical protein [Nocardia fluminea]|uniref:Uncharacterized protein n=1 Tax=Nocardia fluminea TaxID=134984 RepID=A0A2N3VGX8_9NOCA|nr:hypothetical protein [Nocardia fluminea]PKV80870.1 hypothetical protein ATK86_5307 [Nocardia fluminea]